QPNDCRDSSFGISRMRSFALYGQLGHESALLCSCELFTGGFADDHKLVLPFQCVGRFCAGSICFFTHDEEVAEILNATFSKTVSSSQHGGDNSFCVTRSTAIEKGFIFTNCQCQR